MQTTQIESNPDDDKSTQFQIDESERQSKTNPLSLSFF